MLIVAQEASVALPLPRETMKQMGLDLHAFARALLEYRLARWIHLKHLSFEKRFS